MRNIIATIILILGLSLFILSIGANIYGYLQTKNVDGWLAQTRHAGTAEKMANYCNLAIGEMERLGMNTGYVVTLPIPITPEFDMAVKYEIIQSVGYRAEFVAENTELNTIQQSQALADLRNQLSDFRLMGTSWYILNHGFFFKLAWFYGVQWLILAIIGIVIYKEQKKEVLK